MAKVTDDGVLAAIGKATEGLLMPSETDAPLEPFAWDVAKLGEPSPETARKAVGAAEGAPVETTTLGAAFGDAAREQSWFDATEKARQQRFAALLELLSSELGDLRVYRVGKGDETLLALGKSRAGAWLGLRTRVVAT